WTMRAVMLTHVPSPDDNSGQLSLLIRDAPRKASQGRCQSVSYRTSLLSMASIATLILERIGSDALDVASGTWTRAEDVLHGCLNRCEIGPPSGDGIRGGHAGLS
ncbi:MAG TPA: hypothetical protein VGE93_03185, partial [Bryobacteraceae bacterium]